MKPQINSLTNPKIKWVKSLHKNSARRSEAVFVVEGAKEIASALSAGYEPHSFFICPEIYKQELPAENNSSESIDSTDFEGIDVAEGFYSVSKPVYQKITYRSGTDGLLAVFVAKQKTLIDLNFADNPFFIIVEAVEKPGNLGAIIRTADGVGADGVIICNEKTDLFNPNVIRSSVGTLFSTQVVAASNEDVYDFLQNHEITPFGAIISDHSKAYFWADFTRPTAVILGTEHDGLSEFWIQRAVPLVIPMLGNNDSLNVSAATAVLSYEVLRQRVALNSSASKSVKHDD